MTMKRLRAYTTLVLGLSLLTNPLHAQDKVYFDIKTSLEEKRAMLPVELGTTLVLSQSDWAGVLELGEDFCIYLKNYRRKVTRNTIYVAVDIELCKPGTLKAGQLLDSHEIRVKINRDADVSLATELYQMLKSGFEISAASSHNEAIIVGKLVEESVRDMYISLFRKQTNTKAQVTIFAIDAVNWRSSLRIQDMIQNEIRNNFMSAV
jgi:hypothetical protein